MPHDAPTAPADLLTWRRWPIRPQLPFVPSAQWRQIALELARTPHRVWLVSDADPGVCSADVLAAWAQMVRRAGRVPAVLMASPEPTEAGWAVVAKAAAMAGGLLAVVGQFRSDQEAAALQRAVTALRTAALGLGRLAPLPCQALLHTEVALQPPATPPVWQPACADCAARRRCPGPAAGAQVAALPAAISNQLDLLWTADAAQQADRPSGTGPANINAPPWRVQVGGQWQRLVGIDGTSPELASDPVLDDAVRRGQLYLDVSNKARLDDFAADLRLLLPTAQGWLPAAAAPFAAEETRLVERLARLRGLVVDVGAGPIRYLSHLAAAIASGEVRYVAVEPDAAALQRTRAALPGAALIQGTGEALPLADASADAVLLLRSVNHIPRLAVGLAEALRVLRPGGTLILVDNVVFALVRSPEQLAAAHAISTEQTPFEHYRNDDAAAVQQVLLSLGVPLRLLAVEDVGPGTSNQWCLVAERLA